ncbi:Mitochondrial protein cyt-4 [Colletotrichum orbiculare MAFF 240422]|uniref:Mitochondrial protein cyt-4 n=1 Tax=Colletotrichum orbiculare (strain 104-T / ATCC 96160 / CBS 514.97 / LARS 414 / MAFF 240422) TaxID=1213857 RepID=N4V399_COLOR|nr:Mitochondrial protein cyt-4 [Colletotrichum orbiculare MAFF 240422]
MLRSSSRPFVCWRCLTTRPASSTVAGRPGLAPQVLKAAGHTFTRSFKRYEHPSRRENRSDDGDRRRPRRVNPLELTAEENERIRSNSDIRERLREWESENYIPSVSLIQDLPTQDIPLSNHMTRPDMLAGSTEALADDDRADNKSSANRALYDGDELLELRSSTSALLAGDLVEVRYRNSRRPALAICLGRYYGLQYFYMGSGEVVPERNLQTLFTLTNFVDPKKFKPVVDLIPEEPVSNPRNLLYHRKNLQALEAVAYLQKKINKFTADSVAFYQSQPQLDMASNHLTHPDKPQYLSLEQIAEKLLPDYLQVAGSFLPHVLYAVHNAIQRDDWGFRPLNYRWHRRNYIYEVRPESDVTILRNVESKVRHLIEGARLRHDPASSKSLMAQSDLGAFILRARTVIQSNRQRRQWTPHGMIGPDTGGKDNAPYTSWSKTDLDYIRFMELWSCHRITTKASQLETLGSTILRLTGLYDDSPWYAHWTGFSFLQEIGWIPPWDIPARYEYRFPGAKVHRGQPMEMPAVDVIDSLRFDVAVDARRDWGQATIFCVDSEQTEDVDDGFSIEPTEKAGEHWIHIHIADPASAIDPKSDLARAVQNMPSSLYLAGHQAKMLPPNIEEDFSLADGKPTLTFSAKVNERGQILDHKVQPGRAGRVLHVPKDEVAAILPGLPSVSAKSPFAVGEPPKPTVPSKTITRASSLSQKEKDDLLLLNRLCKLLARHRTAKGQLPPFQARFSSPEVSLAGTAVVGNPSRSNTISIWSGEPFIRFSSATSSEADRLVERLMHTAGEVAAKFCSERRIPVPYSVQPEALRNAAQLAEFRKQHIDPLTAQGKPVPVELLHTLFALIGTSELSVDPAPFYSVGLDAYAKSSSPLRRFGDLVVHWQIHAALARERQLGRSLAGDDLSDADFLPWTRAALTDQLPMLQAQQRQIKQVDNKDGPLQWIAQAVLRAWKFGEAPLPDKFTFVVDGLYPFGLRGRLQSFYNLSASIDIGRLAGVAKMAEIQVDDQFEVEIVDINVVTTQIAVKPLRRVQKTT